MDGVEPYTPLGFNALPLLLTSMSIAALRAEVRKADDAYRIGEPIMSDHAYDLLIKQLQKCAPHAPELHTDVTELLSLSTQLLEEWYDTLPAGTAMVVQPKINGCSLGLRYVDGELQAAWTRSGRCAMDVARLVPSIPIGITMPGIVEVHGELWGIAEGESQKAAARALNRHPSGDGLVFTAFRLVGAQGSESCSMEHLSRRGFDVPDTLVCTTPTQVRDLHQKWTQGEQFDSWPTDGIVVKVFDHETQKKMGATKKAPRWALAMKLYD